MSTTPKEVLIAAKELITNPRNWTIGVSARDTLGNLIAPTTTKEILIAAKELIAKPKHWTIGVSARDSSGEAVPTQSSDAVSFCSLGAIRRAAFTQGVSNLTAADILAKAVHQCTGGQYEFVSNFNDTHTHSEVLDLFDKAISLA